MALGELGGTPMEHMLHIDKHEIFCQISILRNVGQLGLGVEVEEKGIFAQGHGDPGLRCHCPEKAAMAPKAAPTPGVAWTPPFLSTSPPFHGETRS